MNIRHITPAALMVLGLMAFSLTGMPPARANAAPPNIAQLAAAAPAETAQAAPAPPAGQQTAEPHGAGFGKHCGRRLLLKEASALLGMDKKSLKAELRQGKTLAMIAKEKKNWSEDVLIRKLNASMTRRINQAVSEGKLTREQADRAISVLSARIKQTVSRPFHVGSGRRHPNGLWVNPEQISKILGISKQELRKEIQAGKSLADIAKARGIREDQLISRLKESLTGPLKKFVEYRHLPQTARTPKS